MRRVTTTIWGSTSRPDSLNRSMISVSSALTWSRMYTICTQYAGVGNREQCYVELLSTLM